VALRLFFVHGRRYHVDAAPPPALHVALSLEVGDHARHRVAVDPQIPGQRPDARQPAADLEAAGQDEVLDLPLQLHVYRDVAFRIYL
jgi:hypothetical protein